jgi:hypothetical protein
MAELAGLEAIIEIQEKLIEDQHDILLAVLGYDALDDYREMFSIRMQQILAAVVKADSDGS